MTGMGPFPEVPAEAVEVARARTRQQLGAELEGKASNEFCLAYAASAAPSAFAEVVRLSAPDVPALVEFVPSSEPAAGVREGAGDEVDLGTVAEGLPPADSTLPQMLRRAGAKLAREDFLRRTGLVRDELERTTTALMRTAAGATGRTHNERPFVQICWLNETVRTADSRSIATVAADPAVERIDVPRRLMPDAVPLDVTLRAVAELRRSGGLGDGEGVSVGVIDSEVALRHPAFGDRVIHRRNFTSESWGVADSHGTAVAGIIGAVGEEYAGLAPGVTISNYKVIATSPVFNATDFEGALAIQQALEDGIRVVNCSWGAGPAIDGRSREARACDAAWRFGLTIVKSAGNRGPDAQTLTTPADAEGVIVVGATHPEGAAVPDYSSRGPTGDGRPRPHLLAPGGSDDEALSGVLHTGGYGEIGMGTSFAAPHVTGLIALLLDREPGLSPDAQRDRLLEACEALPDLPPTVQGQGLLRAEALLG